MNQFWFVLGLSGALVAGNWHLATTGLSPGRLSSGHRLHASTAAFACAIALGALGQAVMPQLLAAARRDAPLIAAGEWWRLVTALFVQDGGVAGALFNLASLLLIGNVAEAIWGSRLWMLLVAGGGVVAELVALRWQPTGAGNSVCTFSLAGSVCAVTLTRRDALAVRLSSAAAVVAYSALLADRDIHGLAALVGVAIGFLLRNSSRRQIDERPIA